MYTDQLAVLGDNERRLKTAADTEQSDDMTVAVTEHLRLVVERSLMMRRARQQRLHHHQTLLLLLLLDSVRTIDARQHHVTVITFTCNQPVNNTPERDPSFFQCSDTGELVK